MEEMGSNFVVVCDEDGNEIELEHLDTLTKNGKTYMAFLQADAPLEAPSELIVLRLAEDDGGEEFLTTLDNEAETEEIFRIFVDRLEDYFDAVDEEEKDGLEEEPDFEEEEE